MSINFVYSSICSFCALIILLIMFIKYYSNKNKKNIYFLLMLIFNILVLIFDLIYVLFIDVYGIHNSLTNITCRLNSYLMLLTLMFFLYYIFIVGVNENFVNKYKKTLAIALGVLFSLTCVVSLFLELDYNIGLVYNYSGDCVIAIYISVGIIIISILALIGNKMKISKSQKYCYTIIIACLLLYFAFQFTFNIDINAQSFILSLLTISLYFNVESQDNISILYLDNSINNYESSNVSTSNIISNLSSNINNTSNRIIGLSSMLNTSSAEDISLIKNNINNLFSISNKVKRYSMLKFNEISVNNTSYTKDTIINRLNEFISFYSNNKIKIKYNFEDNFPNKVNIDYDLFIDIISEIINYFNSNKDSINLNINIDYTISNNIITFNVICISNIFDKNILENENDIYSFIINKTISLLNGNINYNEEKRELNYSISFNILN